MLRYAVLATLAVAVCTPAQSADMPERGRIGKIFDNSRTAKRHAPRTRVAVREPDDYILTLPRKVPGYYGTPTSFQQRSYYGTTKSFLYDYIPITCEFSGIC